VPVPATRTLTKTRTPTATITQTRTRTPSITRTPSFTTTPSRTATATRTTTLAPSATATRTTTGSPAATPTLTVTITRTPSRTPTATRSGTVTRTITRTPSVTPTFQIIGPTITFLGVARADGQVTSPVGTLPDGTPIFERPLPHGFFLVVEARNGPSNRPPGSVTFNSDPGDPNALPNLQIVVSRPLGNGSGLVCDDGPSPPIGGVPATDPPMFGGSQASANAINDLGCRFDARETASVACTRNPQQESAFASPLTRTQYCPVVGIGAEIGFAVGDTRVTARVTDNLGQPGQPASIIIRVLQQ